MKKIFLQLFLAGSLLAALGYAKPAFAQDSGQERRFPNPQTDVDQALQEIQDSVKGRLPILDGFVEESSQPLDHFERGYYECSAKVSPDAGGGTRVRITAKITAWYTDPTVAAQSGYRVLPSSGRIETDLLDHLGELLQKKMPVTASPVSPIVPRFYSTLPNAPVPVPAGSAPVGAFSAPVNGPASDDLKSLRRQREEAEKKAKALNDEVQNYEEILRNRTHPENLAVVRKAGTSVFARQGGSVLLTAAAEDEFEILGLDGNWVHVQISGASRGWIRRSELDLPEGFAGSSKKESDSSAAGDPVFHITREETHPYTGSSQELMGKTVRILWVAPIADSNQTSTARIKRDFAKATFARAYKEQSSAAQPPAGVVMVFDSADGGQVSVPMSDLAQWQSGKLSEAAFWKQCSIDPPELFQ